MENSRRGENRKGRPHNNTGGKNKNEAPSGFEGMNYEQKRKPYREGIELEKDRNGNPGSGRNMGRRRDDL